MKTILFNLIFLIFLLTDALAFDTRYPAMPVTNEINYENHVIYDKIKKICLLKYEYENTNLIYKFDLKEGGDFGSISANYNNYEFYPSIGGGIIFLDDNDNEIQNWLSDIRFNLIDAQVKDKIFYTKWIMSYKNVYYVRYNFNISIVGKSLIIKISDIGPVSTGKNFGKYARVSGMQLDRSENCINPSPIRIPYLTNQNILYTNGVFVSTFFDWTKTNSSQIIKNNGKFSESSIFFSQYCKYLPLTNGKRNKLKETIYFTVSENIEETFPTIPNPVSKYKNESVSRIVFDSWKPFNQTYFMLDSLSKLDLTNLWLIVHNWHNKGYDKGYPDIYPANPNFGGSAELLKISNFCQSNGYLFSVHEMYSSLNYDNPNFSNYKKFLTKGADGNFIVGWKDPLMYRIKPSKMIEIFSDKNRGALIHNTFKTTAGFLDVHPACDPSYFIDLDFKTPGAGKFYYTLKKNQEIGDVSRKIHNGPVSGEGSQHFLYAGYYDDVEPQIQTANDLHSGDHIIGCYYQPVLVDFDLLKIKPLMFAHGMGYYERFFHKDRYWKHMGRSIDSALIYSATELAFGHGAFFSDLSYNVYEQAELEYQNVYPVQKLYGISNVSQILYNDNGNLITLSDYLRKYPTTYDKFDSDVFLSQVFIQYENGLKVYVNRHPGKTWEITFDDVSGWYNYHAMVNGVKTLYIGNQNPGLVILPKDCGWICYSPIDPPTTKN